jgi:hypothetical protein
MRSRGQIELRFGLSATEMKVVLIVRIGPIKKIGVDQRVAMAGIRLLCSGGATPIPCKPK